MASAARLGNKVDAGLLIGCVVLSLVALVLRSEDKEPIASVMRRSIVAPLVSLQRGAERWRTAWVSSEQRQLVADSITLRAVKAQALQTENDQLRKIVGLGSRLESGFIPAEALHSTAQSEEVVTSLTLTAGSTAGVQRYSPIVSADGLVGTIQTADPSMSTAILYTNPDFRASAMAPDGTTFGIVYPHSTGATGSDAYMLELRGVPTRAQLKPGTTIYTSGLGGTFPRGITIGTVIQEIHTSQVWTKTYLIRPAVSPSGLTTVLILVPQRVTQGIGNVWGAAINGDSASKRIAMAGDSIRKQAALLEAKARLAALDSAKRSAIDSVKRALGVPLTAADSAAAAARAQAAGATVPPVRPAPSATAPARTAPVVRDTTRVRPPDTLGAPAAVATPATPRSDSLHPDSTRPRRPPQ
ncbi:MAG TPA: rod shape-determining protein MreC, partial [Gemmatimonadaceae bacterium]|nr:rod shape-determining protein MreC [Gemmatimonadaceae bacterium]